MPSISLDTTDAAELGELLQFLAEWLARDPDRLGASLENLAGHPACGIQDLRDALERFAFLLGGSDSERARSANRGVRAGLESALTELRAATGWRTLQALGLGLPCRG